MNDVGVEPSEFVTMLAARRQEASAVNGYHVPATRTKSGTAPVNSTAVFPASWRRGKLLFISEVFPFPLDRGQRVRVQNLLAACGRAFDVTFVGPRPDDEAHCEEVDRHCAKAIYLADPPEGLWARWHVLREAAAVAPVARGKTIRMYERFVAALQSVDVRDFDVVWAERVPVARLFRKADMRARTIVDLDDIEHVKLARQLRLSPTHTRPRDLWRYARYRNWELKSSRRFLASVVCSVEDRDYLLERGCNNAVCVPNGVVLPANGAGRRPTLSGPCGPKMVFVGNVDYEPNGDAIAFFSTEILPRIRARMPDASFDVIGRGVTPADIARAGPNVRFRGFVEDLGAALKEYDLMVAPIRFGSGTKLKVLDAMAHEIPLVTTTVGAEGLAISHGEHAWIADSPEAFASGVCALATDGRLAAKLASNAFSVACSRFSWGAIQDRLVDWLQQL
jgi:glycosyltransferase involved in cell wall biosynthesis